MVVTTGGGGSSAPLAPVDVGVTAESVPVAAGQPSPVRSVQPAAPDEKTADDQHR
jgi:hypothetical protein